MKKSCKQCNISFEITNEDLEFYNKISPVFDWKKYEIPTPTLCPDCRQQRRFAIRNDRKLYKSFYIKSKSFFDFFQTSRV